MLHRAMLARDKGARGRAGPLHPDVANAPWRRQRAASEAPWAKGGRRKAWVASGLPPPPPPPCGSNRVCGGRVREALPTPPPPPRPQLPAPPQAPVELRPRLCKALLRPHRAVVSPGPPPPTQGRAKRQKTARRAKGSGAARRAKWIASKFRQGHVDKLPVELGGQWRPRALQEATPPAPTQVPRTVLPSGTAGKPEHRKHYKDYHKQSDLPLSPDLSPRSRTSVASASAARAPPRRSAHGSKGEASAGEEYTSSYYSSSAEADDP